ncbi:phosphopyruvate hydratase [Halalkalicoccus salilacus]|uniref:phosphopyruvate hydratase n=1 Tax=Halalkalicoccus TaxID=332246 RepID=UPI002F966A35
MSEISAIDAWEVLDSRGHPTVCVAVETAHASGRFTVPAGASTGTHEAVERRDGTARYRGRGVRSAVAAINDELAPIVVGRDVSEQRTIDEAMCAYDGTETLSEVGANAILGVSGAVAHAASNALDTPLYRYLAPDEPGRIPLPMVNVLSGGLHAEGGIEIQDFLVVPIGAETYDDALRMVWDVRQAVRDRIVKEGHRPLVADEGGFSPPMNSIDDAFVLLETGVRDAGYEPGTDLSFAIDVAATHFYDEDQDAYELESIGKSLCPTEMIDHVVEWTTRYPLVSIEDPLAEDDWEHWIQLHDKLGDTVQLLGDDLLVTDQKRLERVRETGAANAVLVKPNQTGTITGTIELIQAAHRAGFSTVVSARSGETSDTTIADLAVAFDAGQIKIGSLARSERLVKYNRLIEISRERGDEVTPFPFH